MEPNKHEPEVDPIISDTAARFTMALLLALFTIGAILIRSRSMVRVHSGPAVPKWGPIRPG